MYESGQSGGISPHELREVLRRLEAALVHHEQHVSEAQRPQDTPAAELLCATTRMLTEEIDRLRAVLAV